jgi:hypothetical protein
MRVYQHSGTVPIRGALFTLVVGSAVAMALGALYSFTFQYIPYVHLNFLLAIGFGALTGFVVAWAARQGKIRHTAVTVALATVAIMAGIYVEWGTTVYALCPADKLPQFWANAGLTPLLPHYIVGLMLELFDHGSWSLDGGGMVHGWPLVALWLMEAGMIIAMAVATAHSQIAKRPFCEKCQEWIACRPPHLYVGDGAEAVWSEIRRGTFENLAQTPHASGGEETFVKLTLRVCEGCSESNYLTITKCVRKRNTKGQEWIEEKELITNGILKAAEAEIIEAANTIAPGIDELPLDLSGNGGKWTLQPSPVEVEVPAAAQA